MTSIPTLVTTTLIDGDELGFVPSGFDVVPTADKSTQSGTLGLTRVGWAGLGASANISVQYERLQDDEADLLLMLAADQPDGRARIVAFSRQAGEPTYATRRITVTLSSGSSPGTWSARVEFNANVVPL